MNITSDKTDGWHLIFDRNDNVIESTEGEALLDFFTASTVLDFLIAANPSAGYYIQKVTLVEVSDAFH